MSPNLINSSPCLVTKFGYPMDMCHRPNSCSLQNFRQQSQTKYSPNMVQAKPHRTNTEYSMDMSLKTRLTKPFKSWTKAALVLKVSVNYVKMNQIYYELQLDVIKHRPASKPQNAQIKWQIPTFKIVVVYHLALHCQKTVIRVRLFILQENI